MRPMDYSARVIFCCHLGRLTTLINALNEFLLVLIVVFSPGFIRNDWSPVLTEVHYCKCC